jgi:hypothetical protein
VWAQDVEAKSWRMPVGRFELRDASIEESIRALADRSRALDPTHEGINFVRFTNAPTDTQINLRLSNIPLHEAARYVARLAGMRLAVGQHALLFVPDPDAHSVPDGRVSAAGQIASGIIIPRVEFRNATLAAALRRLEDIARAADRGKLGFNIVLDVPPAQRETPITLSLANVPAREALRYVADLADLVVIEEPYALVVTTSGARPAPADPAPALADGQPSGLDALAQSRTRLDAQAQPATNNTYRDLNGNLQPEKSGYVPQRSMGGWPMAIDPNNGIGANAQITNPGPNANSTPVTK